MAVEQKYMIDLAAPNVIPGHKDLETLAREDWYYAQEVMRDAHYSGVDIAAARIRGSDVGFGATMERVRIGAWGIKHTPEEKQAHIQIAYRALGFASVLSAQLQSVDWQPDNAPTVTLPPITGNYNLLRDQIVLGSIQYFDQRRTLKKMSAYFMNEAITDDRTQQRSALMLVGFGLRIMDKASEEQFLESQTAALSELFDVHGVLPTDAHDGSL